MRITYIGGAGRLGIALASWSAHKGHQVVIADVNAEAVYDINAGYFKTLEPQIDSLVKEGHDRGLLFATTDVASAAGEAEMIFIVVPTPSHEDGSFDMSCMVEACLEVGRGLSQSRYEYPVVVIVSTVNPGDTMGIIASTLTEHSGLYCGLSDMYASYGLVYSPEFIAQGSIVKDFANPDILLIGASDRDANAAALAYYDSVLDTVGAVHDGLPPISAEIAKIGLNCAVVAKITVANMLTMMCQAFPGADAKKVLAAIGDDRRIGRKYFSPGLWPGGPCFPRDNRALAAAFKNPANALARAIDFYNKITLPGELSIAVSRMVAHKKDATICVAGLTYKPGVPIVEDSPGVLLCQKLVDVGVAGITAYDPLIEGYQDPAVLEEADVVVITLPGGLDELYGRPLRTVLDCWGNYEGQLHCERYFRLGNAEAPPLTGVE